MKTRSLILTFLITLLATQTFAVGKGHKKEEQTKTPSVTKPISKKLEVKERNPHTLVGTVSDLKADSFTLITKDDKTYNVSTKNLPKEKEKTPKTKNKIEPKVKKTKPQSDALKNSKSVTHEKKDKVLYTPKDHVSQNVLMNGLTVMVNTTGESEEFTAKRVHVLGESNKSLEKKRLKVLKFTL